MKFQNFLFALTLIPQLALALNVDGEPIISGRDCDESNTSVVLSPDNTAFTILFSSLVTSTVGVEPNQNNMKYAPQKSCNVRINFRPRPGHQIELKYVEYRGYMDAPGPKTYAWFQSKHEFIGGSVITKEMGRVNTSRFVGALGIYKNNLPQGGQEVLWQARYAGTDPKRDIGAYISNCTGTAPLSIEASVKAHTFDPNIDATVMMDSADGQIRTGQTTRYEVREVPCDAWNKQRDKVCRRGTCH